MSSRWTFSEKLGTALMVLGLGIATIRASLMASSNGTAVFHDGIFNLALMSTGLGFMVFLLGLVGQVIDRRLPSDINDVHLLSSEEVEKLIGLYRTQTTLNADRQTKPYEGKWRRVEGTVVDVRSALFGLKDTPRVTLSLSDDIFAPRISLTFRSKFSKEAAVLQKGETIAVLGKIDTISVFGVDLKRCQLVSHK